MNCDGAANAAVFANSGIATVVLPLEVTTTRIGSIWYTKGCEEEEVR